MTNENVKNNTESEKKPVFNPGTTTISGKIEPGRERFAFQKGLNAVPHSMVVDCKNEICAELGWQNRTSWYKHLYGVIEPRVSEAEKIESIFAKYGVHDVWGA